jgi:hypothetical protein
VIPRLKSRDSKYSEETNITPVGILLSPTATQALHAQVLKDMKSADEDIETKANEQGCGSARTFRAGRSLQGKGHKLYDQYGTFSISCGEEFLWHSVEMSKSEGFIHSAMLVALALARLPGMLKVLFYDIACRVEPFLRTYVPAMSKVEFLGRSSLIFLPQDLFECRCSCLSRHRAHPHLPAVLQRASDCGCWRRGWRTSGVEGWGYRSIWYLYILLLF